MDVAGTRRDSLCDYVIYKLDYWTLCFPFIELGVGRVSFFYDRLNRRLARLVEELAHPLDRRVHLFDALHNPVWGRQRHPNSARSRESQCLLAIDVVGIGGGDVEERFRDRERQDSKFVRQFFGHRLAGWRADHKIRRDPAVSASGEQIENVVVGRQAILDGGPPVIAFSRAFDLIDCGLRKQLGE